MKRYLTFLLIISMAATWLMLPAQAVRTSGTCGENVTWSYDETTNQLTVTGTGPMVIGDHAPWLDLCTKITSVVIEEGITDIAYGAFSGCSKLHTVILPSSVNTIDGNAFQHCSRLKNISLDHITQLGQFTFGYCEGLEELIVPSGLTEIPYGAFIGCRGLQKVTFHENVKIIGYNAFNGCTGLTSIVIPDSVVTIEGYAFSGCSNLETVDLGESVTELPNGVFSSCSKLESIRIPDSVTKIDSNALNDCAMLKEVYLGAGIAEIAVDAFWKSPLLKAFTISEQNPNLSVDQGVLYTKDWKELVLFPPGFTGAYTALTETVMVQNYAAYDVQGITALILTENVRTVGKYAFCGCKNLKTLRLSEGLERLRDCAFARTGLQKVVIPSSVIEIGQMAFSDCTAMKQMVINGEPPMIKGLAFLSVEFTVFYPEKTSQWLETHGLYGGIPNWELQCTEHSYVGGTCSRCGVSDPNAVDFTGSVTLVGNDYGTTQVQLYYEDQTEALRTYTVPAGAYLLPELLPGAYKFRISAEGYATREYAVDAVSGTLTQDITLHPLGDINGDGRLNTGDVARIYAHTKATAVLEDYALACADFNPDGKITVGDVAKLYAHIKTA